MSKEKVSKLDAFLIWINQKVVQSNEYDLLDYGEIAEIASEEFGDAFTAEHIGVALSEINKRRNYYIAPWDNASGQPPAEPA